MKYMGDLRCLVKLTSLHLSFNRISDIGEIEKVASIPYLAELTVSNNPVARKQLYRPTLIRKVPTLKKLDGKDVSRDERERVEMLFASAEQRNPLPAYFMDTDSYSSARGKVPVKLTSMNFESLIGFNGPAYNLAGNANSPQNMRFAQQTLGAAMAGGESMLRMQGNSLGRVLSAGSNNDSGYWPPVVKTRTLPGYHVQPRTSSISGTNPRSSSGGAKKDGAAIFRYVDPHGRCRNWGGTPFRLFGDSAVISSQPRSRQMHHSYNAKNRRVQHAPRGNNR